MKVGLLVVVILAGWDSCRGQSRDLAQTPPKPPKEPKGPKPPKHPKENAPPTHRGPDPAPPPRPKRPNSSNPGPTTTGGAHEGHGSGFDGGRDWSPGAPYGFQSYDWPQPGSTYGPPPELPTAHTSPQVPPPGSAQGHPLDSSQVSTKQFGQRRQQSPVQPDPPWTPPPPQGHTRRSSSRSGHQAPQQNVNSPPVAHQSATPHETVNAPSVSSVSRRNVGPEWLRNAFQRGRSEGQQRQGRGSEGSGEGGSQQPRPNALSKQKRIEEFNSATASNLRQATRRAVVKSVVKLLQESKDVQELGEGFRFAKAERAEVLKKTVERINDADVVSFKGIADFVIQSGNVDKVTDVVLQAITPEDGVFPSGVDPDQLKTDIRGVLSNVDLMSRIVAADPTKEFLPASSRRQLKCEMCTPVESFICAHCWPSKACGPFWWCKA